MLRVLRNSGKTLLQWHCSPDGFMWKLPVGRPAVALTFDDGPDPQHTPVVLDLLAAAQIRATFFLVGSKVEKHPDLVLRMAEAGHSIGGHTWNHREIVDLSATQIAEELARCRRAIRDSCGVDSKLFRPPRGKLNLRTVRRVCGLGYCLVHWSKTYGDYKCDGTERLVGRLRRDPPGVRDVLLFHDHNPFTTAALVQMLPEWQKSGLSFAAI